MTVYGYEEFAAPVGERYSTPKGCQSCGKVGSIAAHRPGCRVAAAWDVSDAIDKVYEAAQELARLLGPSDPRAMRVLKIYKHLNRMRENA